MDESEKNGVIVDAKRRAKAHARATGESHQKSLDHVARLRGREDWSAFLADPVAPKPPRSMAWIFAIRDHSRRHPMPTLVGTLVFTFVSLVIINLEGAARNGIVPFHMPVWLWLPCMVAWGIVFATAAAGMLTISAHTLMRMDKGVVDTSHVIVLINTIMLLVWILVVWHALEDVESVSSYVAFFVMAPLFVVMMVIEGRASRRERERRRRSEVMEMRPAGTIPQEEE